VEDGGHLDLYACELQKSAEGIKAIKAIKAASGPKVRILSDCPPGLG